MHESREITAQPRRRNTLARVVATVLFSLMLGISGPAFAAHGGGGGHGGGGFHGGGGVHAGGFHGGGFHGGGFRGGGFRGGGFRGGFGPAFALGLGAGLAYPYAWGSYAPDYYDYSGYDYGPYAAATWYYCSNPPGYYPYVAQCYGPWQPVPAQ
jgi:hypothetical protein